MKKILTSQRLADALVLSLGIALAIAVRLSLRLFLSQDYLGELGGWYDTLRNQGFAAIGTDFSNYTPAYLYLLYLVSILAPTVYSFTAVKIPPMLFDFITAWFVYRIVAVRFKNSPLPVFAFFAVLFAPTIILNSSMWGQFESIYTAMLVACIYFITQRRDTAASLAFGVAISIKLQAIFLLPFLLALVVKGRLSWKSLIWIPLVFLVSLVPAWIAGRPLGELATIYLLQTQRDASLTINAPSVYAWLPEKAYDLFLPAGIIWAACLVFGYIFVIWKSRASLHDGLLIKLGLLSLILVPFVLPKMHERYFYPMDVLSIAYAFFYPRHYYVPIAFNLISFFTYLPFLYMWRAFTMPYLALGMLVLLVLIARSAVLELYAQGEGA